jgi:catechol 2,3-dioxygenase-like lactoylglutathione lyase family enzyme
MPPLLDGLLETAIYVDDVEPAVAFYRDVLGLTVVDSSERLTAMSAGPRQLLLVCRRRASLALPLTPHDATGSQHIAFAIPPGSLDAWESWLAERRVRVLEKKRWERGGTSLYFSDPDGHLLELATPGVWSVY